MDDWDEALSELLAFESQLSDVDFESLETLARQHLLSCARFPRNGDIFEALNDTEATYLTPWIASFTGGSDCVLAKGTMIKVCMDETDNTPIRVFAVIFDNDTFETQFIPEAIRTDERYDGLLLTFSTAELNESFRLISN